MLIVVGVVGRDETSPPRSRCVCNCHLDGGACRWYPSDVSGVVGAVTEPLMPVRDLRKGGAVRKYGDRLVLSAIFFVLGQRASGG